MKAPIAILVSSLLGFAALQSTPDESTHAASSSTGWLTDLGQAGDVARATGKPILAVFRCEA